MWALTNSNDNKKYELAVNLEDWSGNKRFARYKGFRIGPESDKYRLYFTKMFLGNAGDSLFSHNGLAFSTFDVDNDNREGEDFAERSCARLYKVNFAKIDNINQTCFKRISIIQYITGRLVVWKLSRLQSEWMVFGWTAS